MRAGVVSSFLDCTYVLDCVFVLYCDASQAGWAPHAHPGLDPIRANPLPGQR
jgi:hypothetical protein